VTRDRAGEPLLHPEPTLIESVRRKLVARTISSLHSVNWSTSPVSGVDAYAPSASAASCIP